MQHRPILNREIDLAAVLCVLLDSSGLTLMHTKRHCVLFLLGSHITLLRLLQVQALPLLLSQPVRLEHARGYNARYP